MNVVTTIRSFDEKELDRYSKCRVNSCENWLENNKSFENVFEKLSLELAKSTPNQQQKNQVEKLQRLLREGFVYRALGACWNYQNSKTFKVSDKELDIALGILNCTFITDELYK